MPPDAPAPIPTALDQVLSLVERLAILLAEHTSNPMSYNGVGDKASRLAVETRALRRKFNTPEKKERTNG